MLSATQPQIAVYLGPYEFFIILQTKPIDIRNKPVAMPTSGVALNDVHFCCSIAYILGQLLLTQLQKRRSDFGCAAALGF